MSFSPKDPSTEEYFDFDYAGDRRMAAGETILSASISISVVSGRDPNANSMLSGSVVISGRLVRQLVVDGVVPTKYHLKCLVTTSNGQILDSCGDFEVQECN